MILNPDSNQKGAFHENSVIFTSKATRIFKKEKAAETETFFVKVKLFLIFILPVVIILLTVKVLKTFLQIKLRNAASKTVTKDQEKK